jgi:Type IV secretion system pilin
VQPPQQILDTFNNLLNIATGLGLLICALFLILAGFAYMTSGGNPGAVERSKSAAFNAATGFAIILSARVLATMINNAVVR